MMEHRLLRGWMGRERSMRKDRDAQEICNTGWSERGKYRSRDSGTGETVR